jgi:CheY-like chemotaxis protein
MIQKNVLIIDDEKDQAVGLAKALQKIMPDSTFESYSSQDEILEAIENRFFTLAIVDLRMDKFSINGIDIINKIIEVNPFASVIIVSAFLNEYFGTLKKVILTGRVIDIQEKETLKTWPAKLKITIDDYHNKMDSDPSQVNNALLDYYADAKNEPDTFKKGTRFEHFISLLFQSFGFNEIQKRFKDQSLNETDLIIRNEIDDGFLSKFGKYILIECKNKPLEKVNKNDFIVFKNKLNNTAGLADLGIIATSGYITWNTYIEAVRESSGDKKVLFMSNPEIEKIIRADDKKDAFKRLIDTQVKDN